MAYAKKANFSRWVLNASLPDVFVDLRVDVQFFVLSNLQMANHLFSDDLHGSGGALETGDVPGVAQGATSSDSFGRAMLNHLIAATCCVAIGVALGATRCFGRS